VSAVILLVRHAETDAVGVRLTGRQPGVALNGRGLAQVEQVCRYLRDVPLTAIYSSPLERALGTASPIAASHGLEVRIDHALNEVDFGEWTGLTFDALARLPGWRRFNESRGSADVPGGERAPEMQRRIVSALADLGRRHQGQVIAAVSHAELIRAAVLHATGAPLRDWQRVEISPASITTIQYEGDDGRLIAVNVTGGAPVDEI
jgi:broad specificity phosphatase PhoE